MHSKFSFKTPESELLDEKRQGSPRHRGHLTAPGGGQTAYLSVGVLVMLLIARVVILLDEAKVLLPLPLQGQLPSLGVCREIALKTTLPVRG